MLIYYTYFNNIENNIFNNKIYNNINIIGESNLIQTL